MKIPPAHEHPARIVRLFVGGATVVFLIAGVAIEGADQLLVVSGAFGLMWWAWDLLVDHLFRPIGDLFEDIALGGRTQVGAPTVKLERRMEILKRRLSDDAPRKTYVAAAIRLAELYHFQRKDEVEARRVLDRAKSRFPDAPELEVFERALERGRHPAQDPPLDQ